MADVDAVVCMAAIVGEAACASRKDLALRTNYFGPIYQARVAKAYGIKRFIYFSTCSTYGKSEGEEIVNETSALRPVDFYGETKIYAEREIVKLIDENFAPTILRLSTVYGMSPRMRFDLVVNTLTKKAMTEGEIMIFGGGQWRPLIHTQDVALAVRAVLDSSLSTVGGQIFNVGGNEENYLVSQLGDFVKQAIPEVKVNTIDTMTDRRSYRVDFQKIKSVLGFRPQNTVSTGVQEIIGAFQGQKFTDPDDKRYYNHLV
jgi:nucleoside-diphosphate-sugar epimerase